MNSLGTEALTVFSKTITITHQRENGLKPQVVDMVTSFHFAFFFFSLRMKKIV